MSQKLQWTNTIARSGKHKDVPNVLSNHREASRDLSRKKYHVRFQGARVKKRRVKGPMPSVMLDVVSCSPSNSIEMTRDSLPVHVPDLSDSGSAGANNNAIEILDHFGSLPGEEISDGVFHSLELDNIFGSIFGSTVPVLGWPSSDTNPTLCNGRAEDDACSSPGPASFRSFTSSMVEKERNEFQDYAHSVDSTNMGIPSLGSNPCRQVDFLANAASPELCSETLSRQNFLRESSCRTNATMSASPLSSVTISEQPHSSRYLQYYIEHLVPRFTPLWNTLDNPFLTVVIPGFLSSPILNQAVMALAASQFALISDPLHKNTDKHNALQYQTSLIATLKYGSKEWKDPDPTSLLACIMMQSTEVLSSGMKNWNQWLQSCVLLLKARDRMEQDMREDTLWLLLTKITVAMETLAAITANTDTSLATRYWDLYLTGRSIPVNTGCEPSSSFQIQDAFFEKLLGCPATVLYVLSDMAAHSMSFGDLERETNPPAAITEKITQWEQLLYGWYTTSDDPKARLMEAFRHASLVHFLRRFRQLPYTQAVVQYHVRLVIENLARLDAKDYTVVATWPAMIAGLELDEIASPDLAAALLSRIGHAGLRRRPDSMFQEAGDWLKVFWKQRKQSPSPEERATVVWQDAAAEHGSKWCFW